MTADQRLDQLEPIMSESIAILDRHTAQLKQLIAVGIQHSESITFLVREVLEIKGDVAALKTDVAVLKTDMVGFGKNLTSISAQQEAMTTKLDAILSHLTGSGG